MARRAGCGLAARVDQLVGSPMTRVREEARVRFLLWGRANAGKSTLFNRLVGREAAITSSKPGTTRDPVSAVVEMEGTLVEVVDLPGVREHGDAVEAQAAEIGESFTGGADTVLYLFDVNRAPCDIAAEWQGVVGSRGASTQQLWPIINKVDVAGGLAGSPVDGALEISARLGRGVDGTLVPIEWTIALNQDYLLEARSFAESFEPASPTVSDWTHAPTTGPGDEWQLVTCKSASGTTSYKNGPTA